MVVRFQLLNALRKEQVVQEQQVVQQPGEVAQHEPVVEQAGNAAQQVAEQAPRAGDAGDRQVGPD
jgi:hypothetical protein